MQRALRYSVPILLGLFAIPQADALIGTGMSWGGGDHGGGFTGFHGGTVVIRTTSGTIVRRPGFMRQRPAGRFVNKPFLHRFANKGFQDGFPFGWGGLGWSIGDWWPYAYQPVQQAEEPPAPPEIININIDSQGRHRRLRPLLTSAT